jgi:hypothetical protein
MDGTLEEISNLFITDGNRCTAWSIMSSSLRMA